MISYKVPDTYLQSYKYQRVVTRRHVSVNIDIDTTAAGMSQVMAIGTRAATAISNQNKQEVSH
jgi:hypothetical protein